MAINPATRTNIIDELQWRGLIHQATDLDHLREWLESPRVVYAGFDPTSDSLHVGSLIPLLLLRRFQRAGHRPIAVVGGATGMVGDPSGKSQERNLLGPEVLERNVAAMKKQMERFLDFDAGPSSALVVNNYDWMRDFTLLAFLRDIGKNVPVNVMLSKESIKARLQRDDSGLSYTEFSYMLLQAYDFVYLNRQYGCELQVGGSDQWGNITAGIDLARRMDGVQLYGLTCPLLTKSDGTKMGKTESGAIWLDPNKTSTHAFYQYWFNVSDDDVGTALRILTDLPREEIEALDADRQQQPERRASQIRLAEELTRLVHGPEGLQAAEKAKEILFGAEVRDINDQMLAEIFAQVPSRQLPRERLSGEGLSVIEAFCEAGLASSRSDVRRAIDQGGAYVNNRRVSSIEQRLTHQDLATETTIVLRLGKKRYGLLRFE